VDERYARSYRELYERHWWWRAREELILDVLRGLRSGNRFGRILDVGCGDGLFFGKLSDFGDVEGVEMDPAGLQARGPWADRIRVQPFDERFRPSGSFGLILMLDVLEHFPDARPALRRALELLDANGRIVITVPAFRALWTRHDDLNHHYTRFRRSELAAVTEAAGGVLESSRYFFQWTVPLKLGQHWLEKVLPGAPSVPGVPPRAINSALLALSRAERRLFRNVAPPFGSSLLGVVARP
jgi:SAM-dependent methyltransferase